MKIQLDAPEDVERPQLIRTLRRQGSQWGEWCRLLRFLRFRTGVSFPVTIEKGERPDFTACSRNRETTYGIELTWAAHQSWEQASAHMTHRNANYQISRSWFGGINKKGRALQLYVESKQSNSASWHPREHAMEKINEIADAVCRKSNALAQVRYKIFDKNVLLITDKMPFLLLDLPEFQAAIVERLSSISLTHDATYFVTKLRNRSRQMNEEVLFRLSASCCAIVRRLPISYELQ